MWFWWVFFSSLLECNASWPLRCPKGRCGTWWAVPLQRALAYDRARHRGKSVRLSVRQVCLPLYPSLGTGSTGEHSGGAQELLGRVHSDGVRFMRFMSPSSGLWLQPAEARTMLQPVVGAGWSGNNREQIWPIFSSVAWPQNCSESLLCNILDVPEQVKFLIFLDSETIFLLFCIINDCKIQIEISCWYVGFLSGFVWFGCYAWFLTKHNFQCTFMSAMALFETAVLLKVPRRVMTLNSRHPSFD